MASSTSSVSKSTRKLREEDRAIFNEEVDKALNDGEIRANLEQLTPASGLDESYLRDQCNINYEKIKESANEQQQNFSRGRTALQNANNIRGLYRLATTPYFLRTCVIISLGLAILAFVESRPGYYNATADRIVLLIAACMAFVALITPTLIRFLPPASWTVYRAQAVMLGGAIGVFWAGVLTLHTLTKAQTHHRPSVLILYIFWLIFIPVAAMPFLRIPERNSSRTASLLRPDVTSTVFAVLGFLVPPLASLLAGSRNAVVVTAKPSIWLFAGATALAIISLLFALAGIFSQPLAVLSEDYKDAEVQLRTALGTHAILPFLREIISEQRPSNSNELKVPEARGLSEQFDPIFEVSTSSKLRVDQILQRLSTGGSLGLAGPRGSGKSTLLRSYCGESRQNPNESLAVLLSAPVEYSSRDFLLHLYATLCRHILKQAGKGWGRSEMLRLSQGRRHVIGLVLYGLALFAAGTFLIMLQVNGFSITTSQLWGTVILLIGAGFITQATLRRRPGGIRISSLAPSGQATSLEEVAADRLEEIRFQQTISATWSGAIKSPIGFEGTLGGGENLVRQAMLLPEIVDSLREFLESAGLRNRVIVGIDELDKMESDERAKQFLNEIKGVFGARGCYFLVSVSEDAIGSFERRGIPFRDVFDSSFDEIVQIRCLSFNEAEAVLNRRVTRMPIRFKQLCYCLSGGLSRDLIRAARNAVDASNEAENPSLSVITSMVLAKDLKGKADAISAAMAPIEFEPQVSEVLHWVRHVELDSLTADSIQAEISRVDGILLFPEDESERRERDLLMLRRLTAEFAGYCYYVGTLLDIFAPKEAGSQSVTKSEFDHEFDVLAVGRQLFTVNTLLAWKEISEYRKDHGLSIVLPPSNLQGMDTAAPATIPT